MQGEVTVENAQLDDMILLRADARRPTCWPWSSTITTWASPTSFARRSPEQRVPPAPDHQGYGLARAGLCHIPLIHGPDGAKLSKRHGALGVDAYRDMGFLPAALRNYLLRLGWGHGDDEIISTEQAIEWFDLAGVGRSASRFDMAKLTNLNAHYLRETPDAELLPLVLPRIEERSAAGRRCGPRAHRARPERREAAGTHVGRTRRQSCFLRTRRRAADLR